MKILKDPFSGLTSTIFRSLGIATHRHGPPIALVLHSVENATKIQTHRRLRSCRTPSIAVVSPLGSLADKPAAPFDMSLEMRLMALSGLTAKPVDIRHSVMLTVSMSPYLWTIDNQPWRTRRKIEVKRGQRVELEFMNHTMMAHPMHLHGHHFQVVGIGGQTVTGAVRDTVMVPAMGRVPWPLSPTIRAAGSTTAIISTTWPPV